MQKVCSGLESKPPAAAWLVTQEDGRNGTRHHIGSSHTGSSIYRVSFVAVCVLLAWLVCCVASLERFCFLEAFSCRH